MGFIKVTLDTPPPPYQCDDAVFVANSGASLVTTGDSSPSNYDANIAARLCEISTWSYSDISTFKEKLSMAFPGADFMEISVVNDSLLINAYAQIIRHERKVIVCFRGTELVNPISWLVDLQAGKEPIIDTTEIDGINKVSIEAHGGFVRNFRQVWEGPRGVLRHLLNPKMMNASFKDYDDSDDSKDGMDGIQEIYITGHSLGGAMAYLAGLSLSQEEHLNGKLRGIYTYGQPMVTSQTKLVDSLIGSRLFRHIYWNDIVPHLPPLSVGTFAHCGTEYRAFRNGGYEIPKRPISQVLVMLPTIPFALFDFIVQNVQWTKDRLKLPWSIADHIPYNYLSAFQKP